jgi:hypothetical protein
LQKCVASLIRSSAFRHSVLTAVCFDNELGSEGNEVDDVTPDRRLSPEMKAEAFQFAQLHPQFDFLRGETLTKRASMFVCQDDVSSEGIPSHAIVLAASARNVTSGGRTLSSLADGRDQSCYGPLRFTATEHRHGRRDAEGF